MRFLSRDSADEYVLREETRDVTRLDVRTIGALERFSVLPDDHNAIAPREDVAQTELERAIRLQRDTAEYATALQQQLDILIRAYDEAFARWNTAKDALEQRLIEQGSLTRSAFETIERRDAYVCELEAEVLAAWEGIDQTDARLREAEQNYVYYKNELTVANRVAAEREKRLAIAAYEAQQSERAAVEQAERAASERVEQAERAASERADQAERQAQAALRKCEEHRERADWASDERARLAKCYEDACAQARHIGQTLNELERDLTQALSAKDSEIAALKERCTSLETDLLTRINAALEQARAESERLSTLIHGVQQGRFWRLKRFTQRLRGFVHR